MRILISKSRLWCAAVLGLFLLQTAAHASSAKDIEAKVALESSLEKRLQSVLREVLGSDDLIVIVNVETLPETEKADEILPGVMPKTSPAAPGSLGMTLSMVRRVSATVIVDQGLGENDVRLIKQTASGILGIAPERGDSLSVETIKFHKPAPVTPYGFLSSALGIASLCLAFMLLVVILLQFGFLHPLLKVLREASSSLQRAGESGPPEEKLESPGAFAATTLRPEPCDGAKRPDAPFSFLCEGDLAGLEFLLRKEKPLAVAVVMHYAPPSYAAKILAVLDPQLRREAVSMMAQVTQLEEAYVRELESSLRKRTQYIMGGEDKLTELLDTLNRSLQIELLQSLQSRDPGLVERLVRRMVFLDDLALLEPADIKALVRLVPIRTLASVIKPSEKLRNSILPKLAEGMRDWLTQEIDLSPNLPAATQETQHRQVLDAVRKLMSEGRITLRKQGN